MHTTHAARITEQLRLPEEFRGPTEHVGAVTGGAVNVSLTMLHHPALAQRYHAFGIGFIADGVLPARDRELIILRTSWRCASEYEWAHHTRIGLECGLTEAAIRRVTEGELDGWDARDAELLSIVDSVVLDHTLDDRQWVALSTRYGTAGAIETVMLAGHYAMLAGLLNSAGTRVEPGMTALVPLHARHV
ncbi:carboxymuconolactone decarboxylase family protein [Kutzneria buriramensis]|uniref:Alkylhydroperoxidase family enzyme n=1 Tax=Kutzneria buriramensis TaxID=1045776 RepID=A0A3E0HPV4_9PSEU|nr:carboxymuconolactone decarboxylase family protein [Kutzneria buriramensis]REH48448.1 alkylhydroperoxidase family enzyme [Kutzneria buriramensis]